MGGWAVPIKIGTTLLGGLAGAFGNKPQTTTNKGSWSQSGTSATDTSQSQHANENTSTSGYSNTNSTGQTNTAGQTSTAGTSSSAPVFREGGIPLLDALTQQYLTQAGMNPDLSAYTTAGINQINNNSALRGNSIRTSLASRGLGYSNPSAFADIANQNQRSSDVNQFQAQIPVLANQIVNSNLDHASNFLKSAYGGQESQQAQTGTTGSQTSTSQQSTTETQQFQQRVMDAFMHMFQSGATDSHGDSNSTSTTSGNQTAGFFQSILPFIIKYFGGQGGGGTDPNAGQTTGGDGG